MDFEKVVCNGAFNSIADPSIFALLLISIHPLASKSHFICDASNTETIYKREHSSSSISLSLWLLYEVKSYRQKYISRPSAGDFYLTVFQVISSPSPNFLAGGVCSFAWLQTMETWNETLKLAFFKGSGEARAKNRRVTEEPWKMRCQNALLGL